MVNYTLEVSRTNYFAIVEESRYEVMILYSRNNEGCSKLKRFSFNYARNDTYKAKKDASTKEMYVL